MLSAVNCFWDANLNFAWIHYFNAINAMNFVRCGFCY